MSRDAILTSDDGVRYSFDNLTTQKWLNGHRPGANAVTVWMNEKAVEAFMAGRDDEAVMLRKLAKDIVREVIPKLDSAAAQHERDYPSVLDAKAKKK